MLFRPAHPAHPARPGRPHVLRRTAPLLAASVAATLALASCGGETAAEEPTGATAPSVTIEDAWVRATTGTEDPSMTGAFMVLDNTGDQEVTVTGATSPVAKTVELHEMAMVDGEMVMQRLEDGLALAPGRGQVLQPGGNHVMLMGLDDELAAGDEVELTLELSDGATLEVVAPVKPFTEETGHYHEAGTPEEHEHQ